MKLAPEQYRTREPSTLSSALPLDHGGPAFEREAMRERVINIK